MYIDRYFKMPKFTEVQMSACLEDIAKKDGRSIRRIAAAHNLHEATVRLRIKKSKAAEDPLRKVGRPTILSKEEETTLANCINVLCKNGFSPSIDDVRLIVSDYVKSNKIEAAFKNNLPGRKWMKRFLNMNSLSLKKATMISKIRKDCTSNPFIVYEFYDRLEEIITYNNLNADDIWNMDETAFCLDPKKAQTIAPKGSKAYKITQGGGRENITVVGVVSASGKVMDPVIINQGQNFQHSWRGDKALPNTIYGVSAKGWMTSEVMLSWFEHFIKLETKRPLLLIFDGHLTHFSIDVIKMAIANGLILMKLPPHVTDIMQPLDVAMFGPLKRKWNEVLNEHMGLTGPRNTIRPSDFVNMVCGMWHDAMPSKNAISGFESTGIYPVNRLKYPIERLDERLLIKYDEWSLLRAGETILF